MKTASVILAGGSGTRFWPRSRSSTPKQLLNISGNDAMINETIKRCPDFTAAEDIFVVTSRPQLEPLKKVLRGAVQQENIIAEPCPRNTAPCVLLAALELRRRYGNAVMCVFPSDQYITDTAAFSAVMKRAVESAKTGGRIITLGITPAFAATGYGYIKAGRLLADEGCSYVDGFVEKPSAEKAEEYVSSGSYYWNSGIFIWQTDTIIAAFERFLPRIYERLSEAFESGTLDEVYPTLQGISLDYGILERSASVYVYPCSIGWNDVGSWDALGAIFPPNREGNIIRAERSALVDTKNCIVYSDRQLVSAIGLHDMIVVSTDDALMVCPKNRAQDVRRIVDKLAERNLTQYL